MDNEFKKINEFFIKNKITREKVDVSLFSYLNDTREVNEINIPKNLDKDDYIIYRYKSNL